MQYLPYHQPRSKYCRKHGREYHGYICPECVEDRKRQEFDRLKRREDKEEKDRKFQALLDSIFKPEGDNKT